MSRPRKKPKNPVELRLVGPTDEASAPVFAALGDTTRLSLIAQLSNGQSRSITQLAQGYGSTRQAITKHLRVLENAGLVKCFHVGREALYVYEPGPIGDLQDYLNFVSAQWDRSLARLKMFVEEGSEED